MGRILFSQDKKALLEGRVEDERYSAEPERGKGQKRLRAGPVASPFRALERAGEDWGKPARLDTPEQKPCRKRKSAYSA